ncbi:molecular chaperone DnaK [Flavobacteriaceae bacterium LYZ1037]|nr:molecular chaperone DnaK [Flavobacteriaceae bacterium LYZ1037]
MKKMKVLLGIGAIAVAGFFMVAADHIDAPAVQGGTSDITDFYAFQGQNTNNVVFVANVQGLLSPSATADASFDENVMIEFNIDTTGDNVEDLVIQAIPRDGKMYFFGPTTPGSVGLNSSVETSAPQSMVEVTPYGSNAIVKESNGLKIFAGPRDDPFFMDFAQYGEILAGNATGFNNPGSDTFAGTNVMSIVVEVPKVMLGGSGTVNTWVESKRKQ